MVKEESDQILVEIGFFLRILDHPAGLFTIRRTPLCSPGGTTILKGGLRALVSSIRKK